MYTRGYKKEQILRRLVVVCELLVLTKNYETQKLNVKTFQWKKS